MQTTSKSQSWLPRWSTLSSASIFKCISISPPQGIIVKIKHGRRKLQPLTVKNLLPTPIHWVDCTNRLSQNCGHMSGIVRFSLALHSVVLCNRCTFTASHLRTYFFLKKLDRNKVDIGGSQYFKLMALIKMPY